jgi:hypothetical protein
MTSPAIARPAAPTRPVNCEGMIDRQKALEDVLGSARLEGAEPTPEALAAMRQWAESDQPPEVLATLAERAAAGLPLDPQAPSRAA